MLRQKTDIGLLLDFRLKTFTDKCMALLVCGTMRDLHKKSSVSLLKLFLGFEFQYYKLFQIPH